MFARIRVSPWDLFAAGIIAVMALAAAHVATAQTGSANQWTWMDGSSTANHSSVYGTFGTPSAGSVPGSRAYAVSWTDSSGNLWLFGGGSGNDLWEFNPSTNEWAWMGGSSIGGQPGVYGTLGVAGANIPGDRDNATTWTDSSGNLWLFGGDGYYANGNFGTSLGDLWEFNPSTREWVWMSGSSTTNQPGVYGTLGVAAAGNSPGSRENAASWTDGSGKLWLFGGQGYDATGNSGYLNDLWQFNPSTNEWAWMGGSRTGGQPGVHGTTGTPAAGNVPGGREAAVSWTDSKGNFWLFGGEHFDATGSTLVCLNDLWEFNPSTREWVWMSGSSATNQPGIYGTLGVAATGNAPGSRDSANSWTDSNGHLWLFGGNGYDATGYSGDLNDLWEFNPLTNEWTWMGGSSTVGSNDGQSGVYGMLGTPAAGNVPGGRSYAVSWTDSKGNFWLFGGQGFDSNGTPGFLNDLWEYQPPSQFPSATPAVTVTPSLTSLAPTQGLTLTVVVGENGIQTPTGSVVLTGGGYTSSSTALSGGSTVFDLTAGSLSAGSYTFTASYTPDSSSSSTYNSATGTSPAVVVVPVTATPVFNLPAGSYYSTQTVTISDATSGATIYYTTNGTTPTTSSSVYMAAISVSSSETLEAIATHGSYSNSAVASAGYTISPLDWAWMGGSSTANHSSVYGTLGTPAAGNSPGSRENAASWTDGSGKLWLFGGQGYDATGNSGYLNDLWEFNPTTQDWAWMGGSSTVSHPSVYGTLGTPAAGNIPGSRVSAATWIDRSGHFWLFGGQGFDAGGGTGGWLNDLWEFNPSTNQWACMGLSTISGNSGVYGPLGKTDPGNNIPGSRYSSVSWTDTGGNLWLFGGYGYDGSNNLGWLNDLWEFNPLLGQYGEWAWMGGSSTYNQIGVYGTQGTPAAANVPGSRNNASSWTDSSGHFWLFGGNVYGATGSGDLNDLWEFNPSTNEWAWMGGSRTGGQLGVHGTMGTPAAANIPGSRNNASSWTDSSGHFWLFGGYDGGTCATTYGCWLNDLWEFNSSTNQWAWMSGSSTYNQTGVYGTLGTPAAGNTPGSRYNASSWTDGNGQLWLFGGYNDSSGTPVLLNDLWEYQTPSQFRTATPAVTVTPSLTSLAPTQGLTLTVVVGGNGIQTPTGSVVLTGGGYTSSSTALSGGSTVFDLTAGSLSAGSYTFTASYTPDSSSSSTYNSATGTSPAVVVELITPTITFTVPNHTYGDAAFTVAATSNSAGAINYSVISGSATMAGFTVTLTGVGTVILQASQTAAGNYTAGTQNATFTVAGQTPIITFTVPNHTYGDAPFTVAAISNSSGAFNYSVVSGPATISGSTVTLTEAGTVALQASEVAAGNHAAGTQNATFSVAAATPTISFAVGNRTYGAAPFTVAATSNSAGAFTYSVVSGPATISGSTVTLTGAGTVVLLATEAVAGNYAAGIQNFTFSVAAVTQTITFAAPGSPVSYGVAPISLTASSSSGLAVTFSMVSGPGSISGSTLTITGAGTIVIASNQAGNTNYAAAPQVTQSIVVNQASQSISFTPPATPVTYGVSPITLSATATSGLGVSFTVVSGPGTINGSTLTVTGAGTIVIAANQGGNTNYTAAPQVTQSVVVNLPPSFTVSGIAVSVSPGATTGNTATITVTPVGGFTGSVALTAAVTSNPSGAQDLPALSFGSTSQVTITGASAVTATLTISTTAATSGALTVPKRPGVRWTSAGGAVFACLLLFVIPVQRRRLGKMLGLLVFFAILTGGLVGCGAGGGSEGGGTGNPGTTAGNYTVTVTATSGNTMTQGTVSVTVQ